MGPWDEAAIEALIFHWGDAYAISRPETGVWLAQRLDNRETVRGESPEELWNAITADYAARPVPRETGGRR